MADLNPFDLDDRLKMCERRYPNWIIVAVDNKKVCAYNKRTGERLTGKYTVGGFTGIENKIEEANRTR